MKLKTPQVSKQTIVAVGLAFGGLLLGMVGYFTVVSPEKSRIALIDSQMQVARASLISAEQAPAKVTIPPAKATDLFRLTQAMPDSEDIPGVLIALTNLANASKVTLSGVTPSTEVPLSGYSQVPLAITLAGTFKQLTSFLTDMRRSVVVNANGNNLKVTGRLFVPTTIAISGTTGDQINATLTVDAFVYGTVSPATTTGTTTGATTTTTSG